MNRLFWRYVTVCFACGRQGGPCQGHEYGGTVYARVLRRPWRWLR